MPAFTYRRIHNTITKPYQAYCKWHCIKNKAYFDFFWLHINFDLSNRQIYVFLNQIYYFLDGINRASLRIIYPQLVLLEGWRQVVYAFKPCYPGVANISKTACWTLPRTHGALWQRKPGCPYGQAGLVVHVFAGTCVFCHRRSEFDGFNRFHHLEEGGSSIGQIVHHTIQVPAIREILPKHVILPTDRG